MPLLGIGVDPRVPGAADGACVAIGMLFGVSEEETLKQLREGEEMIARRDRDPKGWMKAHIERERKKGVVVR